MLVVVRVAFAFLATRAARLEARFHNAARELWHELRLPAHDSPGRNADVGAVLTRCYAAQQHLYVRLTEAGVSAGRAALCAVEARVDARNQCGGVHLDASWMRLKHLLGVGHVQLGLSVEPSAKPVRSHEGTIDDVPAGGLAAL